MRLNEKTNRFVWERVLKKCTTARIKDADVAVKLV